MFARLLGDWRPRSRASPVYAGGGMAPQADLNAAEVGELLGVEDLEIDDLDFLSFAEDFPKPAEWGYGWNRDEITAWAAENPERIEALRGEVAERKEQEQREREREENFGRLFRKPWSELAGWQRPIQALWMGGFWTVYSVVGVLAMLFIVVLGAGFVACFLFQLCD
jgi:predicted DNA-binding transcriptional regulator AlpA